MVSQVVTCTLKQRSLCHCVALQPLYGFGGKDPARFAKAAGHQDLLYVHDPELTFEQVQSACLACSNHADDADMGLLAKKLHQHGFLHVLMALAGASVGQSSAKLCFEPITSSIMGATQVNQETYSAAVAEALLCLLCAGRFTLNQYNSIQDAAVIQVHFVHLNELPIKTTIESHRSTCFWACLQAMGPPHPNWLSLFPSGPF